METTASLRAEILVLESKQAKDGQLLKEQFHVAIDSIKPVNLIRSTFKQVAASGDIKEKVLNTAVGLATGYVSRLLYERGTHNPVKKVVGNALMFGITELVVKNPETVKSIGKGFLKLISRRRGSRHLNTTK